MNFKRPRKKKDSNLDLKKHLQKPVRVKFTGGREVTGKLEGFDQFCNLILDDAKEHLRDLSDPYTLTGETRALGLMVCRGTAVSCIFPETGTEQIENPWS